MEPTWVKVLLTLLVLAFLALFLVVPLCAVFAQAFSSGRAVYLKALRDPNTISAIKLTLLAAAFAVPLNTFFGVCAAWAIAKFDFRGKNILTTLIDVPFSVSPVVAGLAFVLVFGRDGWFFHWLDAHDLKIIFAVPGIVLATTFVTFPFVARELIPVMQAQGADEEQAALSLGATGWQAFWRITLPNIKWGLLYGILLCNARAMGEFGAVSVVAGSVEGMTTMPLQIETYYNDFDLPTAYAFAVATLLAMLALVTLVLKSVVEWRTARR